MQSQNEKGGLIAALIISFDIFRQLRASRPPSHRTNHSKLSAGGCACRLGIHCRYHLQQGINASARLQSGVNRRMTFSVSVHDQDART